MQPTFGVIAIAVQLSDVFFPAECKGENKVSVDTCTFIYSRYTGRESPCILFSVPDGHTKPSPTGGAKTKVSRVSAVIWVVTLCWFPYINSIECSKGWYDFLILINNTNIYCTRSFRLRTFARLPCSRKGNDCCVGYFISRVVEVTFLILNFISKFCSISFTINMRVLNIFTTVLKFQQTTKNSSCTLSVPMFLKFAMDH